MSRRSKIDRGIDTLQLILLAESKNVFFSSIFYSSLNNFNTRPFYAYFYIIYGTICYKIICYKIVRKKTMREKFVEIHLEIRFRIKARAQRINGLFSQVGEESIAFQSHSQKCAMCTFIRQTTTKPEQSDQSLNQRRAAPRRGVSRELTRCRAIEFSRAKLAGREAIESEKVSTDMYRDVDSRTINLRVRVNVSNRKTRNRIATRVDVSIDFFPSPLPFP